MPSLMVYLTPPTRTGSSSWFSMMTPVPYNIFKFSRGFFAPHLCVGQLTALARSQLVPPSQGLRAFQRCGAKDFQRMEPRLSQELQLANVAETVQLVDEARIGAGRHAPTPVLELVPEAHPQAVFVLPLHLVLRRPIEPKRAMGLPTGLVETPQRRERILLVPFRPACSHEIPSRLVNRKGGNQGEVELDQLVHDLVPTVAERRCRLFPKPARFPEPVLLVAVVVVGREVLHRAVDEKRLRQTVPVLQGGEPQSNGVQRVHPGNTHLRVVTGGAKALFLGLVGSGRHDVGTKRGQLQSIRPLFRHLGDPRPSLVRRRDGSLAPLPKANVGLDTRCGNLLLGTLLLVPKSPI